MRTLELFNVVWVPACLLFIWVRLGASTWLLRSFALFLVAYIVLQGGIYWHLKAASLARRGRQLPSSFLALFSSFRLSNLILFVGFVALLAWALYRGGADRSDLYWGSGLFLFAVLEHLNYYHYQLMHDTRNDLRYLARHRRLRRSALRKDLDRVQSASGSDRRTG